MLLSSLLTEIQAGWRRLEAQRARGPKFRYRPALEFLEERTLLSNWATVGPNVNIGKSALDQAESTIAINPTNPRNLFASETKSGMTRFSMDGGLTWTNSNLSAIPGSIGDIQAAWDTFGNLFFTRLSSNQSVTVARSSDGGATFKDPRTVVGPGSDQPSIAVGPSGQVGVGSVWISTTNSSNQLVAAGAPVLGFDSVGAFNTPETAPGPGGDFGSIAIGPSGQVLVDYQNNNSGNGPDTIKVNLDPDGLGPLGFNPVVVATTTNVGGFSPIPPQPSRTIDAEGNLSWDRSGGPHNGRAYLVYVDRPTTSSPDTDIFVRFSDNNGTTWSSRTRINDDALGNGKSQLQPAIALDQTTGNVAVTWYDCRNSGSADNTVQVFGTATLDSGGTWCPNIQISAGTTDGTVAAAGSFNLGDYDTMDFYGGAFYRSWADNSNSSGDNPNGSNNALNIYTAKVTLVTAPPPAAGSGIWTTLAPMLTARGQLAGATGADGRIYAIGGATAPFNGAAAVPFVEAYSPGPNSWAMRASLPTARLGLAAAAGTDGRIYAFGGLNSAGVAVADVNAYTPGGVNSWSTVVSMLTPRAYLAGAAGPDGRIYAIGGNSGNTVAGALATVERYTPGLNSWSMRASMHVARTAPAAVMGADGRLYVFGGMDGAGNVLNSVECYNPSTNIWTVVAPMPTARWGAASVMGPSNRLFVLGGSLGSDTVGPATNVVESYNPVSNTWSTQVPMPTARSFLAAAFGADGRIYAFGGFTSAGAPLATTQALQYLSGFGGAAAGTNAPSLLIPPAVPSPIGATTVPLGMPSTPVGGPAKSTNDTGLRHLANVLVASIPGMPSEASLITWSLTMAVSAG